MNTPVDPFLYREVAKFGARDMEACMQCGTCSASCPLSSGNDTFPRIIYRYLQLGLRQKLLSSPVPWLCYYCGECNRDCPRQAEPAETMMAVRRWLTTQYDWTGLAGRLYLSRAWEIGALGTAALGIILLFVFFHGPIITHRVSVNTFAPVMWIEAGDLILAAVLTALLLSNAFRMYRFTMAGTQIPIRLYLGEAKAFFLHFATQKRWRECSEDKTRWQKHFIMVTGYMTMMTLVIVFIRWFQVDDDSWHFTSIFGYYATAILLYFTIELLLSRRKKKAALHRFSQTTDWLFLILLFLTTLTGIFMHIIRLSGWPMGTYVMYVIHLAIAVPMLIIEVPFGKWSHLFYRPLAIYFTTVREKAIKDSNVNMEALKADAGDIFSTCMQCGICTSLCSINRVDLYSPRHILQQLNSSSGTRQALDQAVWGCTTCNACGIHCPTGIDIINVILGVRRCNVEGGNVPDRLELPLHSLTHNGNPWGAPSADRMNWTKGLNMPTYEPGLEYCLFTCCTTAYNAAFSSENRDAAQAIPLLMAQAGLTFGTLGTNETCCGDPAHSSGDHKIFTKLRDRNQVLFSSQKIKKIVTTSPHCLNTFKMYDTRLKSTITVEHYTQILDQMITRGHLNPTRAFDGRVTFHDPCYLGRHNTIFDAPRRILDRIPKLVRVEMADHHESSLCCGGGGGGAWNGHSAVSALGVTRIQQALDVGAGIIATACPFCTRMLSDAVNTLGVRHQIVVRDIAVLLLASVMPAHKTTPAERASQEVTHV